jgi:hypothetical protein
MQSDVQGMRSLSLQIAPSREALVAAESYGSGYARLRPERQEIVKFRADFPRLRADSLPLARKVSDQAITRRDKLVSSSDNFSRTPP